MTHDMDDTIEIPHMEFPPTGKFSAIIDAARILYWYWSEVDRRSATIAVLEKEIQQIQGAMFGLADSFPRGNMPTREDVEHLLGKA